MLNWSKILYKTLLLVLLKYSLKLVTKLRGVVNSLQFKKIPWTLETVKSEENLTIRNRSKINEKVYSQFSTKPFVILTKLSTFQLFRIET